MEPVLVAARAGDQTAFGELVEPLRRELQVHCYRMLGSVEDAEDAVQDTLLRAWARLDTYAGKASFRAWLYGIATHACLDALRRRKSRIWPADVTEPAHPQRYDLGALDLPWLQPYPDHLLNLPADTADEPEAVVTARETIELAFLAAIQRLPARQRAVLILRDTLGWPVKDTAAALSLTPAAVSSALQRAHAALAEYLPARRDDWQTNSAVAPEERQALRRLVAAWEQADPTDLLELLSDDVKLIMPPGSVWFAGQADVLTFLAEHVFRDMGQRWRTLPTAANRQPAFALYWQRTPAGPFEAFAIVVITVVRGQITEIALFQQPELFGSFDLPAAV